MSSPCRRVILLMVSLAACSLMIMQGLVGLLFGRGITMALSDSRPYRVEPIGGRHWCSRTHTASTTQPSAASWSLRRPSPLGTCQRATASDKPVIAGPTPDHDENRGLARTTMAELCWDHA